VRAGAGGEARRVSVSATQRESSDAASLLRCQHPLRICSALVALTLQANMWCRSLYRLYQRLCARSDRAYKEMRSSDLFRARASDFERCAFSKHETYTHSTITTCMAALQASRFDWQADGRVTARSRLTRSSPPIALQPHPSPEAHRSDPPAMRLTCAHTTLSVCSRATNPRWRHAVLTWSNLSPVQDSLHTVGAREYYSPCKYSLTIAVS